MSRFRIVRARVAAAIFVVHILATVCNVDGQEIQIGIIDLYGLRRISAGEVREALTFKEGDTISLGDGQRPSFLSASEDRVARLPGVTDAQLRIVCCDEGRAIVYVGVEERGAAVMLPRAAPMGTARLAADIVAAGGEFRSALMAAVQRGDAGEDRSLGHSLAHNPAMRAIQERFVVYAKRDLSELRRVLRESSDPVQRALAAQVLGYATDKEAVVEDLVQAMSDPSDEVRNNAMRALLVFADTAPNGSRSTPRIPAQPFIDFLNSPVWSDRNKASGALMALSTSRNPELLARLRKDALTPLVEMARWKSEGHALAPFLILARIAGYSDEAAHDLWNRGQREVVITHAIEVR